VAARQPRAICVAGAVALIVAFTAARVALLATSYDANQNWEEPVFLFSATELARDGGRAVFDHQDDLNHGASVVLLLLAVPWLSVAGTSLVALKGLAVLWSTGTLCAFLIVAWRYISPRVALLLAVFCVALSPTAARLNVTLVGSHPEALLPCALALGAYWEWVRRRTDGAALAAVLGWCAGAALWMAYLSAMFVLPLLALRLASVRRWQTAAALASGLLLGLTPWIYQDLWLRPHGAALWMQHVAGGYGSPGIAQRGLEVLSELATSFGYVGVGGIVLLVLCAAAWLLVVLSVSVPGWRRHVHPNPLAVAPLVAAPLLGLVMLASAAHPIRAVEGYYSYRFFIPLQVALFWVLALAADLVADRIGSGSAVMVGGTALAMGIWIQAPLYGQGNHYRADFEQDRARGCHVYGVAEWDRALNPASAIKRLATLSGDLCRERAFSGLGWGLGGDYLRRGDLDRAMAVLGTVTDSKLRLATCGGFVFVVSRGIESDLSAAERAVAARRMLDFCRGSLQ
jgi:hypothetical protein